MSGEDVIAAYQAIRATGETDEGRVRVTLDGSCDLVELVIEADAMRLGSKDLTAAISEAFRTARTEAHAKAAGISPLELTLPEDAAQALTEFQSLAQANLDRIDQLAQSLSRLAPTGPTGQGPRR
jgi:hypothetical protein